MNIAICEDKKIERERLEERLLSTNLFDKPNIEHFSSGISLIEKYKLNKKYDFVFLDVDMPVMNGIEVGKTINSLSPETIIIFYTCFEKYAIDAFDCNAFHYLLKTAPDEKFKTVIKKAIEKHKTYHNYILLKTQEGVLRINTLDIYFVECVQKHLYFHMCDKFHIVGKRLYEIYDTLKDVGFFQVHQGYIVNFDKVRAIMKNEILLSNGKKIPISTRRYADVIKSYNNYVERLLI